MPRFRLSTLLILLVATALWLSTFTNYTGASDVRSLVMLAVVFVAGATAVYSTGTRRAFWCGFFAAMLLMGSRSSFLAYSPRLTWLSQVAMDISRHLTDRPGEWKRLMDSVQVTLFFLAWLGIATILGLLCAYVQRQSQK